MGLSTIVFQSVGRDFKAKHQVQSSDLDSVTVEVWGGGGLEKIDVI